MISETRWKLYICTRRTDPVHHFGTHEDAKLSPTYSLGVERMIREIKGTAFGSPEPRCGYQHFRERKLGA